MSFAKYDAEQYRALDEEGFETRRAEVMKAIEDFKGDSDELTMDDLKAEVRMLNEERERRELAMQTRNAKIKTIRDEGGQARKLGQAGDKPEGDVDPHDTPEYRKAFMDAVIHGTPMPAEFRDAQTVSGTYTQSTDVPIEVPTTMQAQIIQKMEERGGIYAAVRKTSIKAGIWFRVVDLKVTASWIGENQVSEYQKATDGEKVSFSYFQLECRIAQTLLAGAVTFDDFQALFVQSVANAMVDALEEAIVKGAGTNGPLGITVDPRITNVVEMTAEDVADWVQWHKKVKAAMPRLYRNGTFIMGQGTWDADIETLRDSQNHPVSQTGYNPVTGEEQYRLMGKTVQTVDDSVLPAFEDANVGDVFAIFGNLSDYLLNTQPGMPLSTVRWIDHENNLEKTKALMACDGKVLDPYGFILIKKKASA